MKSKKKILIYNGPGTKATEIVYLSVARVLHYLSRLHEFSVSFVGPTQLSDELKEPERITTIANAERATTTETSTSTKYEAETSEESITTTTSTSTKYEAETSEESITTTRPTTTNLSNNEFQQNPITTITDITKTTTTSGTTNTAAVTTSVKLLIIPGGRDLPYVQHLNEECASLIKEFISNGGSYLGICAGAYFSSNHVVFDPNGPLRVVGPRSLALFPGRTVGPAYPGFVYNSTSGCRMVPLEFVGSLRKTMTVDERGEDSACAAFFDGGGYFNVSDNRNSVDCEVLAYYKDSDSQKTNISTVEYHTDCEIPGYNKDTWPHCRSKVDASPANYQLLDCHDKKKPAIVRRTYGKGKVLLSMVHPEMSCKFLEERDYTTRQWSSMVANDVKQFKLWTYIIEKLL